MVVGTQRIKGGTAIRARVLLKVVNRQTPDESLIDVRMDAWTRITDQVWDGGADAGPN